MPDGRIRIAHISTGLEAGGAETMLLRLLRGGAGGEFDPVVISLTDQGAIGPLIEAEGIPVYSVGMRRGSVQPWGLWGLARLLKRLRPRVIQTWMYHADLLGGIAAKIAGSIPVAWGIHNTVLVPGESRRTTILTARMCALLAGRLPTRIVCCSESAYRVHRDWGYPTERMVVVRNGFDLADFAPRPDVRAEVRRELSIPDSAPVVGLVARFDPQKDHRNFVEAAGMLSREMPGAVFVLCGDDIEPGNEMLMGWIREAGIAASVRLLGRRTDVARLVQALDVSGTSSYGEAFPLVVGEAMACGVPCVVTDVGDSAAMVGDTGGIVPPRDPAALAAAWTRILLMDSQERRRLGDRARQRIVDRFDLRKAVEEYATVHRELVAPDRP